ncbi:uncharacterized protein LOC128385629 [Panonychus citri]|uniref:uncharacterized protein LOC128385629 n=1 Tax=Panonychus citri TaxID=50023 RepID=UPI0023079B23|nr:uncharacterized protein LOC128385629 [Panonychus citri]
MSQRPSEEIDSKPQSYIVSPTSTINSLISDQNSLSCLIDSISVSNFLQGLTIKLPIICTLPERLGYYSCRLRIDGETDSYHPNKASLLYLRSDYRQLRNVDLFDGISFDRTRRILPETEHIFRWLHESPDYESFSDIQFVCSTSQILSSMLSIAYNGSASWSLLAIRIGRTIYLTIRDPNIYIKRPGPLNATKLANAHVDRKFTELVALQANGMRSRTSPSGNRDSFYTANKLDIGQYKIIYPNRVDCIVDSEQYNQPIEQMKFALLRNRPCDWDQEPDANVTRAISWWISSFLSGAETIIIGEKSKIFEIRDITTMRVDDLLKVQRSNGFKWTPKKCIDYLKKALAYIDHRVEEAKVVYRFRWNGTRQNFEHRKLRESPRTFIPHWYHVHGKLS